MGAVDDTLRKPIRILPLSDIHLELTDADWDLPELPPFDVMVMAGDLAPGGVKGVEWLARKAGDKDSIYVMGNHEFYGHDVDDVVRRARDAARGTRVHVLQNDIIKLGDTTFIGGTLWTDFLLLGHQPFAMATAEEMMNDYRKIRVGGNTRRLTALDTLRRHAETRAFIAKELAKPPDGTKRVVVTHHGIHRHAVRPRHRGDLISAAYSSDLEPLLSSGGADLWIYGHVHVSDDRLIGGGVRRSPTRVVSNPKGYGPYGIYRARHDNTFFDPALVIEI